MSKVKGGSETNMKEGAPLPAWLPFWKTQQRRENQESQTAAAPVVKERVARSAEQKVKEAQQPSGEDAKLPGSSPSFL